MKRLLLGCLAAMALISCSDDEVAATNSSSPLVSTKQTIYDNGVPDEIVVSTFEDGLITVMNFYSPNMTPDLATNFSYNQQGLLAGVSTISSLGQPLGTTTYDYDNAGRLAHKISGGTITDYVYNSNNSITMNETGWATTQKTFFLNSAGIIYKETGVNSSYELSFNGVNPILATSNWGTKTFEYDGSHSPSVLNTAPIYGNYKPNAVLAAGYLADAEVQTADKYLIKTVNSNGEVIRYDYSYNNMGYPVKCLNYRSDVLMSVLEYFYE